MTINANERYEQGTLRRLKYIYAQIERFRNIELSKLDITSSQTNIMMFLFKNKNKHLTQQDIQAYMLLSHPTISGLLQRMESKGFIDRLYDTHDGRCKSIVLTEKGEEIEKVLKKNDREMESKALDGITEEELVIFNRCLSTIADNLKIEIEARKAKSGSQQTT